MTNLAVFRCDATAAIGLGHVARCQALAKRLEWLGWDYRFAVSTASLDAADRFVARDKLVDVGSDRGREPDALAHALPAGCDLLVVDHYGWDGKLEEKCRPLAPRIMVIDDLADQPHACDIVLDQTLGRDARDYAGRVPDAQMLLGSTFALLRDEFRQARPAALARRERDGYPLQRVLLAFGGTDPAGLTLPALNLLRGSAWTVDVMTSSANPRLDEIRTAVAGHGGQVTLHIDEGDVAGLMSACDVAVGAGGGSAWERCAVGLPALVFVIADNQTQVVSALVAAGAAQSCDMAALPDALNQLNGSEALAVLSRQAAKVCDGLGTVRVAAALAGQETDGRGRICRLEAADESHKELVFAWQSAPGNRQFARTPAAPSWSEHAAWYDRCLADPARLLFVATVEGRPAGSLRLDEMPDGAREVSILLDPASQGEGIGKAVLRLGRRLAPGCRLVAEIRPENGASLRVFETCGYRPIGRNHFVHLPDETGHELHRH